MWRARLEASSQKFVNLAKDRRDEANKRRAEANKLYEDAIAFQIEEEKLRLGEKVKFEFQPQIGPTGEKVILPPGAKMPPAIAPQPTTEQQAAPKVAQVDPKTSQLVLARPTAPAGGGPLGHRDDEPVGVPRLHASAHVPRRTGPPAAA